MRRLHLVVLACLGMGSVFGAYPSGPCQPLARHGKAAEAKACYMHLTRSAKAHERALGWQGLKQYEAANDQFKRAMQEEPASAAVRADWGMLLLERFNAEQASGLFNEALKLDDKFVPAYLGLARLASENYAKAAVDLAQRALAIDPQSFEAHELLAFLALEDGEEKLASEDAVKALEISPEALDALAVEASVDALAGRTESEAMRKLLAVNPVYGEGWETVAHFLVINRRYDEGIAAYRKALALEPDLWSARSQLGINLMREGKTSEARTELERCYQEHFRDAQTVNALRLFDTLPEYETVRVKNFELVLNRSEAALLRPYVEAELTRAIDTYARKYKMILPGPVRLEIYPNHQDFVVRTLGLPGQGGLLGVTFGLTVAMDSPSARAPGAFNWASTLWHELSHVYIVTATRSLVPRWFTEGISVHEEAAASPDWGDRLTPDNVEAIRTKKMLPVADLDRGFVRPSYPGQVLVSYFEAGKIVDYITAKYGDGAVLGMVHSFAARKTTPEAIEDNLHVTAAAFDREFLAWLNAAAASPVAHFDDWKKAIREAVESSKAANWDETIRRATVAQSIYPDYVGPQSTYELMGEALRKKNDLPAAALALEAYRDHGGTSVEALEELAAFETDGHQVEQARRTLRQLVCIFPESEDTHRRWGALLAAKEEFPGAVREYEALVALKPADRVDAHYRLASALHGSGRDREARDEILVALEDAPRYRPAQQLLLELVR